MSFPRLFSILPGALALVFAVPLSSRTAFAANTTFDWNLNTGGDINTGSNWAGATAPADSPGDLMKLDGNGATAGTAFALTLSSSITIGAISKLNQNVFTLSTSNASSITLNGTGLTTVAGTNSAGTFVAQEAALMSNQNNSTYVTLNMGASISLLMNSNLGIGGRANANSVTVDGTLTNNTATTLQLNLRGGSSGTAGAGAPGYNSKINGSIGATLGGGGAITIQNLITGAGSSNLAGSIGGSTGVGAAVTIENAAAGTGNFNITGALGQSISSITQNSATSTMEITSNTNNTNYAGGFTIKNGTLSLKGPGGNSTVNFGSGTVLLGDTSGSSNATLAITNSNTFVNNVTVQAGSSGTKSLNSLSSGGSPVISGNLVLNDSLTVGGNGVGINYTFSGTANTIANGKTLNFAQGSGTTASTYTLSGNFSGAGGIATSGTTNQTASIKFSSTTSDYSGGTTLNAMGTSVIEVAADTTAGVGSFGSGAITLNGATLRAGNGADRSLSNAITIAADTTFATQASEKSLTFAGNATLTGNRTLTVNTGTTVAGKALTFSAPVGEDAAGRSLTKAGTGTLVFEAANTYTGSTLVTAGTLVVGAAGSLNNSFSVTVSAGATLTNNGTALTPALGLGEGATLAGSAGFTPSSLTISGDLTGGFSTIVLSSSLAKAGALDFSLTNATDGSYPLFSGTAPTGLFSSVSVSGNALAPIGGNIFSAEVGGFAYTYDDNLNTLGIAAIPEPATLLLASLGIASLFIRRRNAKHF